jgi:signal transduction histidine kinase
MVKTMKKKRRRSTGVKAFLIVLSYIAIIFMAIFTLAFLNVSHISEIFDRPSEYTQSTKFRESFGSAIEQVTWGINNELFLKEDGEFNPDRLVDIEYYARNFRISGENESRVAYRLEDLLRWSEIYVEMSEFGGDVYDTVVAAKRPDGRVSYFTPRVFDVLISHNIEEILPQQIPIEEISARINENGFVILTLFEGGVWENIIYTETFFGDEVHGATMATEVAYSEDENNLLVSLLDEEGNMLREMMLDDWVLDTFPLGIIATELSRLMEGVAEPDEDPIQLDLVLDSEGNFIIYDNWWYLRILGEHFSPVGANSLLDLVNFHPELNGRLEEISTDLETVLRDLGHRFGGFPISERYEFNLTEGNTNLTYLFVDNASRTVMTNRSEYDGFDKVSQSIENITEGENIKYVALGDRRMDFETNIEGLQEYHVINNIFFMEDRLFIAAVDMGLPVHDTFYIESQEFYNTLQYFISTFMPLFFIAGIFLLISLIWLTMVSGRKSQDNEIHLKPFDRWFTELSVAVLIIPAIILLILISWLLDLSPPQPLYLIEYPIAGVVVAVFWTIFMVGYLSLVKRIKGKVLWQNSIIRRLIIAVAEILGNIDITWKSIAFIVGVILVNWLFIAISHPVSIVIMLLANGVAIYIVAMLAIGRSRINKGVKEMASGDINYQIPLDKLKGDNLRTAELVNSIGGGLHHAVEENMRSERMKTDLITNVSHDIKTPLTSIINYIDLLKREKFDEPKVEGYLEILETKANQLKTLTEDVVEASKVSSGNVDLEMMEINLVEMLHQAEGEFRERFANRNLTVVSNISDESILINVDGKRMWRILENVYSNVVKYAMPGTRVYLDTAKDKGQVTFSVKNISEHPLNISPEELTERFIRGDTARTTEGSGLGLSIAKSLTEMQGGSFELYLDGDLFKVVIGFSISSGV